MSVSVPVPVSLSLCLSVSLSLCLSVSLSLCLSVSLSLSSSAGHGRRAKTPGRMGPPSVMGLSGVEDQKKFKMDQKNLTSTDQKKLKKDQKQIYAWGICCRVKVFSKKNKLSRSKKNLKRIKNKFTLGGLLPCES